MNHAARHKGFTIIELMLAMTFVSVLLLAIALTIVQIGTIYNKGITLKEVNQSGRALSDDITRSITSSSAFSLSRSVVTTTAGGRICTGQYSYVWNYASALAESNPGVIRLASSNLTEVRFLKVPDTGKIYCSLNENGTPSTTRIQPRDVSGSVELLKSGDRALSIHELSVTQPSNGRSAAGQQLIGITFSIGTGDVSALTPDRTSCLPPGAVDSNFAYCAVQQFSLVIRAGDEVN
jgi:type II secretory pathway pseudopilin PulG